MAGSDFYDVQLSAAGAALGQVRVTGTHIDYTFKPGEAVRVLTSEWRKILSRQTRDGKALLEITPATSKPAATAPVQLAGAGAPAPLPAALATKLDEEAKKETPAAEPSGAKSTKGGK